MLQTASIIQKELVALGSETIPNQVLERKIERIAGSSPQTIEAYKDFMQRHNIIDRISNGWRCI